MHKRHALSGSLRHAAMKRRFQKDFLIRQGLKPDHYLLDLGCGSLRGGLPLLEYLNVHRYTGIDTRPEAIREAWSEVNENELGYKYPVLHCTEDLVDLRVPRVDVVWAFSLLIHLEDEQLKTVLNFVARSIGSDGKCFANVNIGEAREGPPWQGFPVVWRPLKFYEDCAESGAAGLYTTDLGTLISLGHSTGDWDQDHQHMLKFSFRGGL